MTQIAYIQLLTTEGTKFARVKKVKETSNILKIKVVKRKKWLDTLPLEGVAFELE
jgi:hypothetical protein